MGQFSCGRCSENIPDMEFGNKSTLQLVVLGVLVVLVNGQSEINRIKADLKDCASNNNKNLNDCLLNLASEIKPYLKTGVPELNIPQADPLSIERLSFDLKNGLVNVNVVFTDNKISGLSEHELIYIEADKEAKTIGTKMFLPASKAVGKYVIDGKVAVLELEPEAPAAYTTKFTNTTVEGVAKLAIQNIGGVERLVIDGKPDIKITLGGLNIKFENLFGGKAPALAKTVDKFLNQNTDKFIDEFQGAITDSVSGFLKSFYNSAVANIDTSVFQ